MTHGAMFGVLGTVAVRSTSGPVVVHEPRRRAVLGALLLEVGRSVPVHRLAALVWGDDRPPSARKAVQVYVSQLRRTLATLPGVELTTDSEGYSVMCPIDHVDLYLFRALVVRARNNPVPARRRALLTEALALWRGPAFADTGPSGLRERVAPGLEEERLTAIEDMYDAAIADQAGQEVIGPLLALTADHPLRERLASLLMISLHHCGRAAEAAEVFRGLRNRMVSETGLEPSRAMSKLHLQILAGTAANQRTHSHTPLRRMDICEYFAMDLPALFDAAERHVRNGDHDRALAFYHAARAIARDSRDRRAWDRASDGITKMARAPTQRRSTVAITTEARQTSG